MFWGYHSTCHPQLSHTWNNCTKRFIQDQFKVSTLFEIKIPWWKHHMKNFLHYLPFWGESTVHWWMLSEWASNVELLLYFYLSLFIVNINQLLSARSCFRWFETSWRSSDITVIRQALNNGSWYLILMQTVQYVTWITHTVLLYSGLL